MYFAIGWKSLSSSEKELSLLAYDLKKYKNIFFFKTDKEEKLKNLAWFTKIGHLVEKDKLDCSDYKIVWTNIKFSKYEKKKYNIKRYKQIELIKTDLEVKNNWIEILFFNEWKAWIVDFYQNIPFYEYIDFQKPIRSMNIWMMPSKLTHLLLNLSTAFEDNKTIYDPFAWLWTTLMIANYFWYNAIWSDINITPCKQNMKNWINTNYYNKNIKTTLFKQDIMQSFKDKVVNFTTNVVSEWFLWPVVWKYLNKKQAENLEKSLQDIYIKWLWNLIKLPKLENIVITFPAYFLKDKTFYTFENTFNILKKNWLKIEIFDDIYHRKLQKIWRQIVIIRK